MENILRVKDLVALLLQEDQEAIVVQSCDPEGNGYSTTWSADTGYCELEEDNSYGMVTVGQIELSEEEVELFGATNEQLLSDNAMPCIILYPSR